MIFNKQPFAVAVVWIVVEIAALNWALVEFLGINLVDELVGSGTTAATVVFGVIGIAASLSLADSLGVVDMKEVLP